METEKPLSCIVRIICDDCLKNESGPGPWSFPTQASEGIAARMIKNHLQEFPNHIVRIEQTKKSN